MLKLLKKSEVDRLKAQERQREIAEGMKIAGRIDALRRTQAEEEASLEKFRRETVEHINNEIVETIERLNLLKKEVAKLEEKKKIIN